MLQKLGLGVVCAALVWGCGGDDDSCPTPSDATTVAELIGPAGGTVELTNGGKVEIPAGALDADTMISITEVANPKPLPLGLDGAGKAYAFKPHGTMFTEPVTITVPFEDDDATEVRAMKLDDDDDDTWQTVVGVDKTEGKLSIETTSFSIYMAARPRRNSGVIVLPDGAIILPGADASVDPDAALSDAMVDMDGAVTADGGQDAAVEVDGGCSATDAGCPVGEIVEIVLASSHACARYSLGGVYCWGSNYQGETGQGVGGSILAPGPVQLFDGTLLNDVTSISANPRGQHTCALRGDGSVVCWGNNSDGQCGSDAPSPALRAYTVPGVVGAVAISAGSGHTCAVRANGSVLCWGLNGSGQLSIGNTNVSATPTPTAMVEIDPASGGQRPIADAIDVAAGQGHTCVVHSGRMRVSCAGSNSTGGGHIGMLGRGSSVAGGIFPTADEALLPAGTVVDSIHIGAGFYGSHTCVLSAGSRPICWGTNTYLQLVTSGGAVSTPAQIDAYYTQPQLVALGQDFTCVSYVHSTRGPRVACQGTDGSGQHGDGMPGDTADPVPDDVVASMDGLTFLDGSQVELMTAGSATVCIKLVGGGVTCWGSNSNDIFGSTEQTRSFADVGMTVPGLP